jgi:FtsP/CotA-like multicopper oxidase with cupredoxin domain
VAELATTIHPHGVRLNYLYDGVPRDQGGAQDPIKVGDTYEQIITFPDTGLFWYHPHTRDDFEQELGEYGTFQIYDPTEKPVTDSENIITLDDILIENGSVAPFKTETVDHTLMGRYGNTMIINGDTNFSLSLKQSEVKRLYLVNTANSRTFDFAIP